MSTDDADRIRLALDDPHGLCDALGLLGGHRGTTWQMQARGVMIRCPWHDEKTPSCSVTRTRDGVLAKCFSCGANADGLGLIAASQRMDIATDYADVLDLGADLAGVARPERRSLDARPAPARQIVRRGAPVEVERAPDDGTINRIAAVLSHVAPVTGSVAAMGYLRERGLDETEALGWYALPDGPARDAVVEAILDEIGYDEWRASGLATLDGPHAGRWSWSWHGPRLVIPWRGPDRTVDTLQGRYMGAVPEGAKRYTFPAQRPPRWPFGAEALATAGAETAAAVVEGAIDAVSFNALARRHGVDALALALPSVTTWGAGWFRCFAGRRCIVGLDHDKAGDAQTDAMVERLRAVARRGDVTVRAPSAGKDWNDALRAALAHGRAA